MPRPRALALPLLVVALAVAGCLGDANLAPTAVDASSEWRGVTLGVRSTNATLHAGGEVRVLATLANRGVAPVPYPEGCGMPWGFRVLDANGTSVRHARPLPSCLGYGEATLAPLASRDATFAWDGLAYPEAEDAPARAAPAGRYALVVAVLVGEDGAFERLEASVPVDLVHAT